MSHSLKVPYTRVRLVHGSEYQILFFHKIQKPLLDVLNCVDDYIEVSKLIKHFTTLK